MINLTLTPEFEQATATVSTITGGFEHDLLTALRKRPRTIAPKYFYDAQGSALFDRICDLPEYYPTRTELGILREHAGEIADLMGPHAELIEFGAGSLQKVRILLDAMDSPGRYLPIDISSEHLSQSASVLQHEYPWLDVQPVVGDYTQHIALPAPRSPYARRIGFFPGSTIGNCSPQEALSFLQGAARLLRGGALILGADLIKDPAVLHAAYNDAQGVTAQFNLNLLARANRELGANFDLAGFSHSAFYNAPHQRVEMHLLSQRAQQIDVRGRQFSIEEGETLHTENSHKFTLDGLRQLATRAGFAPGKVWTDPSNWFSVMWLQAPPALPRY